jgi:thiol:disulfide interchange protein DsbC
MIIFLQQGKTKGIAYVFTDVDCGYCRKIHNEVPVMNQMGIEIRYLAFPEQVIHHLLAAYGCDLV